MASQWYYRSGEEEVGPVTFRELIERVRTGKLVDADLVRPTWNPAWQRAETVVGLFHMARRSAEELAALDAPAVPPVGIPPSGGAAAPDFAPGSEASEEVSVRDLAERPGWLERLWSLRSPRSTPRDASLPGRRAGSSPSAPNRGLLPQRDGAGIRADQAPGAVQGDRQTTRSAGRASRLHDSAATSSPPLPLSPSPPLHSSAEDLPTAANAAPATDWSRTIDAALARADQRASARHSRSRVARGVARLASPFAQLRRLGRSPRLVTVFRYTFAVGGAILVASAVHYWSTHEALRFPSRDPELASLCHFPILGQCAPGEYLFLMLDTMLVAGAAAYFIARWLESRAE